MNKPPSNPDPSSFTGQTRFLRRLAQGLLLDRGQAEDVVQEAWLKALQNQTLPERDRRAWLVGVVRKLVLQVLRRESRRTRREKSTARPETLPSTLENAQRLEFHRLLVSSVDELEEPYRTAILLRFYDGLPPREIARRTGLPVNTVRTQVRRGLGQLRAKLAARGQKDSGDLALLLLQLSGDRSLIAAGLSAMVGTGMGFLALSLETKLLLSAAAVVASVVLWQSLGEPGTVPSSVVSGEVEASDTAADKPGQRPESVAAIRNPEEASRPVAEASKEVKGQPPLDSTLAGMVRDQAGAPIPDAEVFTVWASVRTGEDGSYVFPASSSRSQIMVYARAEGFAQQKAVTKVEAPDTTVQVDFELAPEVRLRGNVVDERGRPLEGVEISTLYASYNNVRTDALGRFDLGHLDPQRPHYDVLAVKDGFVMLSLRVGNDASGTEEQRLVLTHGVRVEGRVVTEGGAPVGGAALYIGLSPNSWTKVTATSESDGSFVFPCVPQGPNKLGAEAAGRAPSLQRFSVPTDRDVLSGVVIVLHEGHFLAGTTYAEDGTPLAQVGVAARRQGESIRRRTTTDDQGRFRLEGLPADDVVLEFFGRGLVRQTRTLTALDHDTFEITLARSGRIAGRVVDGFSGEPIDMFRIRLVRPPPSPDREVVAVYSGSWAREGHAFSGTDGYFDTGDEELQPGRYLGVEARAAGYAPTPVEVVMVQSDPDPEQLILRLLRGGHLTGYLFDTDGSTPLSGVRLVHREAADPSRRLPTEPNEATVATTDANGFFAFDAVPVGERLLYIEPPGRIPFVYGPVHVPESGVVPECRVVFPSGGTIRGMLGRVDGSPRSGELVKLFVRKVEGVGRLELSRKTGSGGEFEFSNLPDGRYQVSHILEEGDVSVISLTFLVRVADGVGPTLSMQYAGSCAVRGILECSREIPKRVPVLILPAAPRRSSEEEERVSGARSEHLGVIAHDGVFHIENLPPGSYNANVSHHSADRSERLYGQTPFVVQHGEEVEIVIELKPPANSR